MKGIQTVRHNVMHVSTIQGFAGIKRGQNAGCKDVCFVRAVGANASLVREVCEMDHKLMQQMNAGNTYYNRIQKLPGFMNQADVTDYTMRYEGWISSAKKEVETKVTKQEKELQQMLAKACEKVEGLYFQQSKTVNDSMRKNFIVKLLFWYDAVFLDEKFQWSEQMTVKIVCENIGKKQEYLFAYLLTLMGCDVLLLQSETDIDSEMQALQLSEKFEIGSQGKIDIPNYQWKEMTQPVSEQKESRVVVHIPERNRKKNSSRVRTEKSFEELARLASSVVMIANHDENGNIIGSGSGIMIGAGGYILTNHHVARKGRFFSVRIEEDDQVYETDEVIKYHTVLDLAVIRIRRSLVPLPVYNGAEKLVRGQKVVAIGSPLGLFNSVSDGIISGFRKIDGVDMIQFTAPISAGSSGGAVLNMYGEVIGISTAGIDDGQNINLAVGYEEINPFIRGFI